VKARHRSARWLGALLIVMAAEVGAQADGTNTQRPLRPGQVRGPKFMVPVLKSSERGLGAEVGSVLRERMMGDYLATEIFIVPRRDIVGQLEASGYSVTEALGENDQRMLASAVQADEYLDGTVTRTPEGTLSLESAIWLPRPEGMVQPLPVVTGSRPGDLAAKASGEIKKARKQFENVQKCLSAVRQNNHAEAMEMAQRALKDYPASVPARVCILDVVYAKKNQDSVVAVGEEILSAYPNHSRALRFLADAYFEKKMEDKYVETVTRLLALNPTDTELAERVIESLIQSGKAPIAVPVIRAAVEKNPGDPSLVRLQWQIYRAAKLYDSAAVVGEEMIKTDTAAADTTFWHALVATYLADSNAQKAQEAAARGAAKFPNVPSLWISVAQLARQNGQLPQALEAINRVVAIDAKFPGAYLQKAQIFSEVDQVDSMVATLRVALDNGADKTVASGMILSKANNRLSVLQRDTTKTVEDLQGVHGMLAYADSLNSTDNSGFLLGVSKVVMGQLLLQRAFPAKSCEDATQANNLFIDAQGLIGRTGRAFPQQAGQLMSGIQQLQPSANNMTKAFCKS
jgi:tetratricopeptide (TPR) repeat protein